ncbi:anthranilate phosphoribosyltransferase [Convivina intestini]|uniref:Anthranilate phosphoribosyltransferase n=1 Tax=Convivina intestini TaxID=1505726 RepID=A0A2U1DEX3_9LACO|nr:anthranilate phosphoribosyltransferase [Convivina intestini]PVY86236.1 anthranilate phosphoribosyltransferase [Convivina intestini]CAH1851281.1 Anthranilate phosphoribosyltransferase [Convivina intestini]CAH1851891.1 Anthranilate phosphoribosyltransferase [Convivina intestini]SDB81742.1 anthranilate phosphoribosyltransferase [Leuconostocaceae bacterium R-53105]
MSKMQAALKTLSLRQDLSAQMAQDVMNEIMSGQASDIEIAAYLMGLAVKNESIPEITGSAQAMIDHSIKIPAELQAMDIVGTGGDMSNTFNISTTASFIVSAAGVPVVKHGNRAASSKSGTADALEALGINIDLNPDQATQVLKEVGQTFLFARTYHPAMKYVANVRKALGFRTVFNVLGPLVNPTRPQSMLMGVYSKHLLVPLAHVLNELGVKNAILVNGQDGLDEVTLTTKTDMAILRNGQVSETVFDPTEFGFKTCDLTELQGGEPADNAQITKAILTGKLAGPKTDIVLINAAMALLADQKVANFKEGLALAQDLLHDGSAYQQLAKLRTATKEA